MIKHGYYLKARQIKTSSVYRTSPCIREVWDYLLREAKFEDSEALKAGQLIRSYQQIANDLAWNVGARTVKYSTIQIKKAMVFFRKHKMVITKRIVRAVLITICNYKYFQDKTNYESTMKNLGNPYKIKYLELKKLYESTKTAYESTRNERLESTSESTENNPVTNINNLINQDKKNYESTSESTSESTENERFIDNIQQYNSIEYYSNIYNKNYPCGKLESEFERDRRIFFESFTGVKTFQLFDDSDKKRKNMAKIFHVKKDIPAKYILRLEELNEKKAGVYLCINETNGNGRTASDVIRVRSVFADLDGSPLEPVWEYDPSMVVESSQDRFHAYWFVGDDEQSCVPLESFKTLQEGIADKFNSDPKIKDLCRVMRIPGFNHMKKEPFMTKIIHYTGQTHDFGYLVSLFPPIPREQWSAPAYQKPINGQDGEFKGEYGVAKGGRNNHVMARIGGMLKRNLNWSDIEQEAYKEGGACNPPLSEKETSLILKSARRY